MTKEYLIHLIEKDISFSNNEEGIYLLEKLDEFFESNVAIPKGTTRHPYADVLHQWLEGSSMETQFVGQTEWIDLPFSFQTEYRIKELQPEYEYLWMDLRTPDDYDIPRNAYMTEKEASYYFNKSYTYFKVEQTMRLRK